jgi:hypothetical protein
VTTPEQAARLGTDPIVLDARFLADLAELPGYAGHDFQFRSSSGSLAMLAAMRRTSCASRLPHLTAHDGR